MTYLIAKYCGYSRIIITEHYYFVFAIGNYTKIKYAGSRSIGKDG